MCACNKLLKDNSYFHEQYFIISRENGAYPSDKETIPACAPDSCGLIGCLERRQRRCNQFLGKSIPDFYVLFFSQTDNADAK